MVYENDLDLYSIDPEKKLQPEEEALQQRMEQTTDDTKPLETEPVKEHEHPAVKKTSETNAEHLGRLIAKYGDKVLDFLSPSSTAMAADVIDPNISKFPSTLGEKVGGEQLSKMRDVVEASKYSKPSPLKTPPATIPGQGAVTPEMPAPEGLKRLQAAEKLGRTIPSGEVITELPSARRLEAQALAKAGNVLPAGTKAIELAGEISPSVEAKVAEKVAGTEAAPLIAKFGLSKVAKLIPAIGNLVAFLSSEELSSGQDSPEIQARLADLAQRSKPPVKTPPVAPAVQEELPEAQEPTMPTMESVSSAAKMSTATSAPVQTPTPTLPMQEAPQGILQRLLAAQSASRQGMANADLLRAGQMIGSGIAGAAGGGILKPTQIDEELYKQQIARAELPVKEFTQQLEVERQDPTSEVSKSARNFIKQTIGVNVPEGISANQLKEQFPVIEKYLQAKENRELRKIQMAQVQESKEARLGEKRSREIEQDITKAVHKLDQNIGSSRAVLGKAGNLIRAAEAVEALAKKWKPNELTKQEIMELARAMDAMLSQGSPTITGTKELTPKTGRGDFEGIMSYIENQPRGSQMGEYVNRLLGTIKREKEVAIRQVQDTQKRLIGATLQHVKEEAPEKYQNLLDTYKLTPESAAKYSEVANTIGATNPSEERRKTKDGRVAIFNKDTKEFLRYE